jgi:hypothetical protein
LNKCQTNVYLTWGVYPTLFYFYFLVKTQLNIFKATNI